MSTIFFFQRGAIFVTSCLEHQAPSKKRGVFWREKNNCFIRRVGYERNKLFLRSKYFPKRGIIFFFFFLRIHPSWQESKTLFIEKYPLLVYPFLRSRVSLILVNSLLFLAYIYILFFLNCLHGKILLTKQIHCIHCCDTGPKK